MTLTSLPAALVFIVVLLAAALGSLQAGEPQPDPTLWTGNLRFDNDLVASWADKKPPAANEPHLLYWVPAKATRLRAVLLVPNNSDLFRLAEHSAIRAVAQRQGIGIIYLAQFSAKVIEFVDQDPPLAEPTFAATLDLAAKATGIDDFRSAPWITVGKSSRGRFPYRTAWKFPDRVVCSISYHGETPPWPMADWSKAAEASILHCSVNGLTEWDGTWYRHVRPELLNYHTNTRWLCHQAVILGVDHGYYPDYYLYPTFQQDMPQRMPGVPKLARCQRVWDYLAQFIDSSMDLRLAPVQDTPGTRPVLRAVDPGSGWLVHPRAPEELLGQKWFAYRKNDKGEHLKIPWPDEPTPVYDSQQGIIPVQELVRPASAVPREQWKDFMWLADRRLVAAWLDLHNTYKLKDKVLATLPVPLPDSATAPGSASTPGPAPTSGSVPVKGPDGR